MLSDFYTKPLQGSLFHRFRAVIMGWKDVSTLKNKASVDNEEVSIGSSSKELVKKVTIMLPDEAYTIEDICEKNKVSSKNSTMDKRMYKNTLCTAGINQVK